eukprot:m.16662 g.16662  ORF g.16662 m.16662 type:complete len:68 (-) comp4654_c0_seq1:8-211(-)
MSQQETIVADDVDVDIYADADVYDVADLVVDAVIVVDAVVDVVVVCYNMLIVRSCFLSQLIHNVFNH